MNIDTTSGQERKHALFKPPQPLSAQLKPFDFQTAPFAKLISIGEVCEMLGVQRTFVNERVASGDLPKPIKFGTSKRAAIRFVLSEIQDYIARLAAERHTSSSAINSPLK